MPIKWKCSQIEKSGGNARLLNKKALFGPVLKLSKHFHDFGIKARDTYTGGGRKGKNCPSCWTLYISPTCEGAFSGIADSHGHESLWGQTPRPPSSHSIIMRPLY